MYDDDALGTEETAVASQVQILQVAHRLYSFRSRIYCKLFCFVGDVKLVRLDKSLGWILVFYREYDHTADCFSGLTAIGGACPSIFPRRPIRGVRRPWQVSHLESSGLKCC